MKFRDYIFDHLLEKESLFDKDSDYQIRMVIKDRRYQVTKWNRGKGPKQVYDIYIGNNGWVCSCPVHKNCKHIKMVKDWIAKGMPSPWNVF